MPDGYDVSHLNFLAGLFSNKAAAIPQPINLKHSLYKLAEYENFVTQYFLLLCVRESNVVGNAWFTEKAFLYYMNKIQPSGDRVIEMIQPMFSDNEQFKP